MELRFKGSFKRDIEKCNRSLLEAILASIINVKNAKSIPQIQQLKKLRKYKTHYRIKIKEDYRLGVIIKNNKIWFVRFGHRKNFYSDFP